MLLFILHPRLIVSTIPCISIHLMLLFILPIFQTIHRIFLFQYISCYCLSFSSVGREYWKVFQYISCYCLSPSAPSGFGMLFNFNTSHVTVYQIVLELLQKTYIDFNTSHVTVYPEVPPINSQAPAFQYISCYCLSMVTLLQMCFALEFQYISCYCLSVEDPDNSVGKDGFQYISCYCLSERISECNNRN